MILIDNYDSFTYNIVQYLEELGVTPCVFKNDEITVEELAKLKFDSIIISPGAGNPDTAMPPDASPHPPQSCHRSEDLSSSASHHPDMPAQGQTEPTF